MQTQNGQVLTELNPGEPKFDQSGSALLVPWGRPQNDGPGLRSEVTSKIALFFKKHSTDPLITKLIPNLEASIGHLERLVNRT